MNKYGKIVIVVGLGVLVGLVLLSKQNRDTASSAALQQEHQSSSQVDSSEPAPTGESGVSNKTSLPRLVDLGASKCIPCKMMAPILKELKREYAGQMNVEFIDVWENPGAGEQYGIRSIPTQIFYDASGKERFRNKGFYSKGDILKKCEELGFNLKEGKVDG